MSDLQSDPQAKNIPQKTGLKMNCIYSLIMLENRFLPKMTEKELPEILI